MKRMSRTGVAVVAVMVIAGGAHAAAAPTAPANQRVQCWTDERGQRSCGDRVPPQYAKQERQIFDRQGRVVQTREREKTAEEFAAEAEAKQRAELLKRDEQKARDYDRFLLTSFEGVKDLERARDERLQILEGRARLLEKSITENDKALAQQRARLASLKKNGKPVPTTLGKRLKDLETAEVNNRKALEALKLDQEETRSKYAADIERYQTLRAAKR